MSSGRGSSTQGRRSALAGRERELATLRAALRRAAGKTAVAIAVLGEPGIGKSRLLEELRGEAETEGWLTLAGRAGEFEQTEPFGVFADALDDYAGAVESRLTKRLGRELLGDLAPVLPALAAAGYRPASELASERFRSHRAVRSLLETLAVDQPLLIELDDLHWADDASVELLGALLRRPPRARVLIATALRPRQAARRLIDALADRVVRVELDALDLEAARALLPERLAESTVQMLFRESGGVPFYLEELARSVAGNGASSSTAAGVETPAAVASALARDIAALDDRERELLRGAAVTGDPFEVGIAAAAAGTDEPDALQALDLLVAGDLVRETDTPRRLRFRHPIVRRAVYESTGPGWRIAAHARVARALASILGT
jgi:predicted ATPase